MDLKVCSLNVRDLGDRLKRREMFNWLRKKNYSIYMLQDVHCSENTISVWSAEWGYKTLFSCCTSARGGVAILFNNNFNLSELVRKVSTRLYFPRQLKKWQVATRELLLFYITCIRSILEYSSPVFHRALPSYVSEDLERLNKCAMKIIYPELLMLRL